MGIREAYKVFGLALGTELSEVKKKIPAAYDAGSSGREYGGRNYRYNVQELNRIYKKRLYRHSPTRRFLHFIFYIYFSFFCPFMYPVNNKIATTKDATPIGMLMCGKVIQ